MKYLIFDVRRKDILSDFVFWLNNNFGMRGNVLTDNYRVTEYSLFLISVPKNESWCSQKNFEKVFKQDEMLNPKYGMNSLPFCLIKSWNSVWKRKNKARYNELFFTLTVYCSNLDPLEQKSDSDEGIVCYVKVLHYVFFDKAARRCPS